MQLNLSISHSISALQGLTINCIPHFANFSRQGATVDKLILSIAFSPGGGRKNISFESLYVGLSRVRSMKDLRILPFKNDWQTIKMLRNLKPSTHLENWINSYTPIDNLLSKMTNIVDNGTSNTKSTPQSKPSAFKRKAQETASNPTSKKAKNPRETFAKRHNTPAQARYFILQSYKWINNNCYLTSLLESLNACYVFIAGNNLDLANRYSRESQICGHFKTRSAAHARELVACTNSGLDIAYDATNHAGAFGCPLHVCSASSLTFLDLLEVD
jgi:hypothetical protein